MNGFRAFRVVRAATTIALVLGGSIAARSARAVDDRVVEQSPQQEEESDRNVQRLEQWFDQNVFGDQPGWAVVDREEMVQPTADGPDMVAAAARLADGRLASIERICELRPAQVRALRLAMESDIRRMAEAVGRERAKYVGVAVDLNDPAGQRRFNLMQQDVSRSRERVKSLFDAGSLFGKALDSVLDEAQVGRLIGSRDQQRAILWKSLVLMAMVELDERLGLDQTQADAIERLLLEQVPPLRVVNPPPDMEQPHMQQTIVFAVLAEVDRKRLKAAVSARQWRALSGLIDQSRGMRANLEHQGFLEKRVRLPK